MRFVVLLSFFIASFARAECVNVRLDDPGKPFEKIPVYDQKKYSAQDPNICYAVVSAELADAYRFSTGDDLSQLTSPLSLALNYKNNLDQISFLDRIKYGTRADDGKDLGPGSVGATLAYGREPDVCDQKWLESYASLLSTSSSGGDPKQQKAVLSFLQSVVDEIDLYRKEQGTLGTSDLRLTPFFKCRADEDHANVDDIRAALVEGLKQNSPVPEAQNFLHTLCKDHSFHYDLPVAQAEYGKSTRKNIPANIEASLKISRPIAVDYCGEALTGQHNCPAFHTSVVIGSRARKGKCEYLVRDSYGTPAKCPYKFPCDRGSVWVPASVLLETANGLNWLGD